MSKIPAYRQYKKTERDYEQERWDYYARAFGMIVVVSVLLLSFSLAVEIILSPLL